MPPMTKPRYSVTDRLELAIDFSRWLLVPAYLGLIGVVGLISARFLLELVHVVSGFASMSESALMLAALALVDMVLLGNLVLMVLIGGYTNFISRIDVRGSDRPEWLDKVDASGIKMKLFGSMVAISGVQVLRTFMELDNAQDLAERRSTLGYMLATHLVFVLSMTLLALADRLARRPARASVGTVSGATSGERRPRGKEDRKNLPEAG